MKYARAGRECEREGGELSLETIVMVFDSEIPDVLAHERSCSLDPGGQLFFDGGKTEWNAGKTVFHHGAARFTRSRCRSRDLFFSPFFASLRKHFQTALRANHDEQDVAVYPPLFLSSFLSNSSPWPSSCSKRP